MSNKQQIDMPDSRCPSCNSPQPHLHPAVQVEGEVSICVNAFHLIPTNQNDRAAIGRVLKAVEAGKLAACEDVLRGLAAYVGNGGYNSETVDPAVFDAKVRDGIDRLTAPLETIIADLRADRVKLQDENDLLRHDLAQAGSDLAPHSKADPVAVTDEMVKRLADRFQEMMATYLAIENGDILATGNASYAMARAALVSKPHYPHISG